MGDLRHVAIILDGNGRWAKERSMPRTYGHKEGAKNVEEICRACNDFGIEYLTVYAFSTENWKRSDMEVSAIMTLLSDYLNRCHKLAKDNNMRIRVIGDRSRLKDSMIKSIDSIEEESKKYDGLNFTVALNYGGRDEIIRAVRNIISNNPGIDPKEITEEYFSHQLDTWDIPEPDLLIRTGGEKRISNFLLWQLCYTEFIFTDVYWPDFNRDELKKCVDIFHERNRRYGDAK